MIAGSASSSPTARLFGDSIPWRAVSRQPQPLHQSMQKMWSVIDDHWRCLGNTKGEENINKADKKGFRGIVFISNFLTCLLGSQVSNDKLYLLDRIGKVTVTQLYNGMIGSNYHQLLRVDRKCHEISELRAVVWNTAA